MRKILMKTIYLESLPKQYFRILHVYIYPTENRSVININRILFKQCIFNILIRLAQVVCVNRRGNTVRHTCEQDEKQSVE